MDKDNKPGWYSELPKCIYRDWFPCDMVCKNHIRSWVSKYIQLPMGISKFDCLQCNRAKANLKPHLQFATYTYQPFRFSFWIRRNRLLENLMWSYSW